MRIGYAICGSFCTISKSLECLKELKGQGHQLVPILSEKVATTDTRFGKANDIVDKVEAICRCKSIKNIVDAEPLGPKNPLDLLIICPCTGNTLAKMSLGITDSCVTMAAKAHLRQDRPLIIALATNDALSANLKNIEVLKNKKYVFFVPMTQDDPINKPHSLVADFTQLHSTIDSALSGRQIQKNII